jgi:hypothetical protein
VFHLGISGTVAVLTCCPMCGCAYVWGLKFVGVLVICVLVFNVLYCLYYVFVLFRLCIFFPICFVCTSVRTTATV